MIQISEKDTIPKTPGPSTHSIAGSQPQRIVVPGYEQLCNSCVFRDFYEIHKAAKDQSILIANIRSQLIAVTEELESLKPKEEPK